jgi:transcriptional regulator with XRE-family HTH domain
VTCKHHAEEGGPLSVVGDNLRQEREARHLTQRAIGRAMGHQDGRYVSAIEHGQKHPGPEMLARLAEVLDIKPEDLTRHHDRSHLTIRLIPAGNPGKLQTLAA